MSDNRQVIKTSDVIALLNDGKTREDIREHYGLSKADLSKLFKNDALKGKKTRKAPAFVFEDDSVQREENNSGNNVPTHTVVEEQNNDVSGVITEQPATEQPSQWKN